MRTLDDRMDKRVRTRMPAQSGQPEASRRDVANSGTLLVAFQHLGDGVEELRALRRVCVTSQHPPAPHSEGDLDGRS